MCGRHRASLQNYKAEADLSFVFDQQESEVNIHKVISSPESPSNVNPG
jgi:hypothetical protein